MTQSQTRRKKQAQRQSSKRSKKKAVKAHGPGSVPADAAQVRRAFGQVSEHFDGLRKVINNNAQVVNQGFMANDIWMETFKRVISDLALGKLRCLEETTTSEEGEATVTNIENKGIDWESYWTEANAFIMTRLQEAAKQRKEKPPEPLIERDDELVTFGGNYAGDEEQEEGTGTDSDGDSSGSSEDE